MARNLRGSPPDPWSASDQAEFRALLRALQQWAGYSSLERLEEGAAHRRTSMPPSTANRALNNDKLPTADFVRRFVLACDADVARWTAARDALHDLKYSRDTPATGPVENSVPDSRDLSDLPSFCPYPGLAAFRPDQAQWFFGREKVTAELLSLLTERMIDTGPLVVVGPSGTGKSSLLRAGLLAALSEGRLPGSRDFARLVFTPTANPIDALGAQLAVATGSDGPEIIAALSDDPRRVVEVIRKLPGTDEPNSIRAVIVVDQFEEAFILCQDEDRRQAFIRALCVAAAEGGGALVVLGLRADHYGRCAAYPKLIEALRIGQVLLGAMTNAQLRSAIEKPAFAAGLELEPGLVEVMLRDLGQGDTAVDVPGYQPGALPLLSHALLATWQQREGRTLTLAAYRLVGGISGAITNTAERAYRVLEPAQQEVARSVLAPHDPTRRRRGRHPSSGRACPSGCRVV
ncbi:MAG: ATP-binding protein [Actinomycetota bacterium]|nr:ATP-binding protein [Actinomycetota bacterium]